MMSAHQHTFTTNSSSTPAELAGPFCVAVSGGFGGGTLALQLSPDNGVTWIPITDGSFTVAGTLIVDLPSGSQVRGTLTGATTPTITMRFGVVGAW